MCSPCCLTVHLTGESRLPSLTRSHPRQTRTRSALKPSSLCEFTRGETPGWAGSVFHSGTTWRYSYPPISSSRCRWNLPSATLVFGRWLSRGAARTRWPFPPNSYITGTMWVWTRTWWESWERTCFSRSDLGTPGAADLHPPCLQGCLRPPCHRATPPGCCVAWCLITTSTSSGASRWRTPGKGLVTRLLLCCTWILHIRNQLTRQKTLRYRNLERFSCITWFAESCFLSKCCSYKYPYPEVNVDSDSV